jgi:hypothetical protein
VKKGKVNKPILKSEKSEKLVEKYDNRIKNFLFEMAKNPVQIKDYMNPIQSVKKENFSQGSSGKQKNFIYKGYQTEKERIVKK